jgi:Kef-type K+ transport system membrane component KefB
VPALLLALVIIVVSARALGRVAVLGGQPAVIGEMVAGLALGPSLLGAVAPELTDGLFAADVLAWLNPIAQTAVALFMFEVGLDLDYGGRHGVGREVGLVSLAGVVVPFLLGCATAVLLQPAYAAPGVPVSRFQLFIGLTMAVTAFPVLARILRERRIEATPLGIYAMAVAAVTDVLAWVLLAVIVAVGTGRISDAAVPLSTLLVLPPASWVVVRPLVARAWGSGAPGHARALAVGGTVALAGAYIGHVTGVHAVFGAFIAGLVSPRDPQFRARLRATLFRAVAWALPVYFALTGLRTQVGLLAGARDLLVCLAVTGAAVVGKVGGTAAGARAAGLPARTALQLGVLMNTRGLMELVVLNIGLDLGILSPRLFTMLVVMTFVTTMMTGPLLTAVSGDRRLE